MLLCLRSPQDLTDVNVWLLLFNPDMHVQRLPGPSGLHGIVHPKCLCGLFGNSYTSQTACLLLILYLLPTKQFVLAVKQGFILCPAFIHHSADLTFVYLLHMHSKRWWWFMRLCWIGKASCSVVIHEPSCATRKNRSLPVVFIFEKKKRSFSAVFFFFSLLLWLHFFSPASIFQSFHFHRHLHCPWRFFLFWMNQVRLLLDTKW